MSSAFLSLHMNTELCRTLVTVGEKLSFASIPESLCKRTACTSVRREVVREPSVA